MSPGRSALAAALFATLLGTAASRPALGNDEPRIHVFGIWPNQIRLFDEATDEVIGEISLKYGAVTNVARAPDFSKFYYVTDRMEAVEIVDLARREVVDTVKLSEQARQVRIASVAVNPEGTLLYVSATPVQLEIDRFVPEESAIFVYDIANKRVQETFQLPKEITGGFRLSIHFAPDGKSLFLLGRDVYQLSIPEHEVIDTIKLSKPLLSGYGPLRGARLVEADPGIYYGLYRTQDPFLKKTMIGVMKLDLLKKEVDSFELGPNVNVGLFAISSDGKRAYGGMVDFISIDMDSRQIVKRVERVEQGRTNTTLLVSGDGKKLYVGGVGDQIQIYDAGTLEHVKNVFAGGDFMAAPVSIPRAVGLAGASKSN